MCDHGRDPPGWRCAGCERYMGEDAQAYGVDEDLCGDCAAEEDGVGIEASRKADDDIKAHKEGL